ncbi:MAG: DUF6452 family protein [Chitinophagales bacterium]
MIKRNKYLRNNDLLILIALCGIVWTACTQQRQPCLTPKIASLNIHCIHKPSDTATVFIDTALPAARFAAFTGSVEKDFIYSSQSANFTLSLSSDADSCKWGISTDTSILNHNFDTLTFFYQRKLQFISNACGFAYFYNLDSVHTTTKMIDSVHIINASVTNNVNTKHLQVYIHPDF